MPVLRPRLIGPCVEAAFEASPVVILEGGRAVGKSTVCDLLIDRHGWAARFDLSDADQLATLRLDPGRFLSAQAVPCVIDEAQLEPRVTIWVKRLVDKRRMAGQFLLTGSARLGRDQLGGSDPLAGRATRLRMWSMTAGEIDGRKADFVERVFGAGWEPKRATAHRANVIPRAWNGGLPAVPGVLSAASVADWERAIASYVEAVIPLGVTGTRADLGRLLRTFRHFAANSGQLVNYARAANDLAMQAATVRNHLEQLESCFLLVRAEAHRPMEHRVVTAHPRVFAADVGLAAWASRAWAGAPSAATTGSLFETSVAHDVMAQCDAHPDRVVVRHWRDNRNKLEVDLLLAHPDGRVVAIETKASSTVGPDDTKGLLAFVDSAPERCHRCVVIYDGSRVVDLTPAGHPCDVLAVPRLLV